MIVMKFGGSSLSNAHKIRFVSNTIIENMERKPIVVLSAFGETTNELIKSGERACKGTISYEYIQDFFYSIGEELKLDNYFLEVFMKDLKSTLKKIELDGKMNLRNLDLLMSYGERISVRLMNEYMNSITPTKYFEGGEIGIHTDSNFGWAQIKKSTYQNISIFFSDLPKNYSYIPLVTGFIGKDSRNNITTLGRGGSDLTASIIAKAVNSKEVCLWKDVDGVFTSDPNLIADSRIIKYLSFEEAYELSRLGASILHRSSIIPVWDARIPIHIRNTTNTKSSGTLITGVIKKRKNRVSAITFKKYDDAIKISVIGNFTLYSDIVTKITRIAKSRNIKLSWPKPIWFNLNFFLNFLIMIKEIPNAGISRLIRNFVLYNSVTFFASHSEYINAMDSIHRELIIKG